jgi:hypothetical protein
MGDPVDLALEDVLGNAALVIVGGWGLAWAIVSSVEKLRAARGTGAGLETLPERDGWHVPSPHAYRQVAEDVPPRPHGWLSQVAVDVRTFGTAAFLGAMVIMLLAGLAFMDGWSLLAGGAILVYWMFQVPKMVRLVRYGLVREGVTTDVRGPTFFAHGVADVQLDEGGPPLTVVVPWRHVKRLMDDGPGARVLVVFHPDDRNNNLTLGFRPA